MAAFDAAVDLGYRYLETDVHATSDGVLVAFHNRRLDGVTDRSGVVSARPWSYVRQTKVDGREPIPQLSDILSAWPDVRVNIDPKSDSAVDPLIAMIRDLRAVDRVCVGSFSKRRLDRVRAALGEELCTSLAPSEAVTLYTRAHGLPTPFRTANRPCAQLPARRGPLVVCTERVVEYAHRQGMQVHAWTVNSCDEMKRLLDIGVDGIITDEEVVLRDVLISRNHWHQ